MPTLYERLLRDDFATLHPVMARFLAREEGGTAQGRFEVRRGQGWLRNLFARLIGIPPAGAYDLHLEVTPIPGGQRWVRHFGPHRLTTDQLEWRGRLIERVGLASLGFELIAEKDVLHFRPRGAWVCGIPWPGWLSPRVDSWDRAADPTSWHVRVRFELPVLGYVAEYEGVVTPAAEANAGPSEPPKKE